MVAFNCFFLAAKFSESPFGLFKFICLCFFWLSTLRNHNYSYQLVCLLLVVNFRFPYRMKRGKVMLSKLPLTINLNYFFYLHFRYLLILDRTNWRTNMLTSLLVPYIFFSLPTVIFSFLRWWSNIFLRVLFLHHLPIKGRNTSIIVTEDRLEDG